MTMREFTRQQRRQRDLERVARAIADLQGMFDDLGFEPEDADLYNAVCALHTNMEFRLSEIDRQIDAAEPAMMAANPEYDEMEVAI